MGLFTKKQDDEYTGQRPASVDDDKQQLFDEYFREELRNHGRWYFDKVIKENGDEFGRDLESVIDRVNHDLKVHVKQQLDATMGDIAQTLKAHVTQQMESQFAEYSRTMQEAQATALKNMTEGARDLKEQYSELSKTLKQNIDDQNALCISAF